MKIPAQDLIVGDIVEVKVKGPLVMFAEKSEDYYLGEKIPADIRITEADGFKVINHYNFPDQFSPSTLLKVHQLNLTGEDEPKVKGSESTSENPLETENVAFYGNGWDCLQHWQ